MNSEKLCLKWNDFKENAAESFKDLKEDFCDVTLASEGNQQIKAHRVILAAASPLFQDMLRNNKHSHPFLYMREINAKHLLNIVTFMYHGEVDIFQEDLVDFLSLAEELEVKGLAGSDHPPEEKTQIKKTSERNTNNTQPSIAPLLLQDNKQALKEISKTKIEEICSDDYKIKAAANVSIDETEELEVRGLAGSDHPPEKNKQILLFQDNKHTRKEISKTKKEEICSDDYKIKAADMVSIDQTEKYSASGIENITEKIDSLIEKRNGIWTCKECGKTLARNTSFEIAKHAEIHIEGVSYTCNQCGFVARSRNNITNHVSRKHKP